MWETETFIALEIASLSLCLISGLLLIAKRPDWPGRELPWLTAPGILIAVAMLALAGRHVGHYLAGIPALFFFSSLLLSTRARKRRLSR